MTGPMSKKWRTNLSIGLLTVAILISLFLSSLVWIKPYRYEHTSEARVTKTSTTSLQSLADVYLPLTAVKTGAEREQYLLVGQPQNVALTAKETLSKRTLKSGRQVSHGNLSQYRNYLRQPKSLLLSYPSAVTITSFNTSFGQHLATDQLRLVDHLVLPLDGSNKVYLLRDQGEVVYRYTLSKALSSRLTAALKGGKKIPVDFKQINNRILMTFPHSFKLATYAAKVGSLNVETVAQKLMNATKNSSLATRQEGNQLIYHNGDDRRLVYDQQKGTLTFENYLKQAWTGSSQASDRHFYRRLSQTNFPQEGVYFDAANRRQQQETYRTYVEGFAVFNDNNYGTVRIKESKSGVESMAFSRYYLQNPMPTSKGSVRLQSSTVVFNDLQAAGKLKGVRGLRVGYRWKKTTHGTVTLTPAYYVKYAGEWVAVSDLIKEGGH